MSETMLLGVLRMPLPDNPAEISPLDWPQIKSRMREAADEIERLRAERAAARALADKLAEALRKAIAFVAGFIEELARHFGHDFNLNFFSGWFSAYAFCHIYQIGSAG